MLDSDFEQVHLPSAQPQPMAMEEQRELLQMMERTAKLADVKLKIQTLKSSEDWPEFKYRLEVFASTLGFDAEMKFAELEPGEVEESKLNLTQKAFSKILYTILLQNAGPAFGLIEFCRRAKDFVRGMNFARGINRCMVEDFAESYQRS